ncbi:MAG: signal recognition particle-docking protein FtsY [Thermofilaceae archaeon]
MLEGLKRTLSRIAEMLARADFSIEDMEMIERETIIMLVECDVAFEAAEAIAKLVKEKALERQISVKNKQIVEQQLLKETLIKLFAKAKWFDLEETIIKVKQDEEPVKLLFVGPNGHGKTTTIAKLGYRLKGRGLSVVFAAADTWRAGAFEQLRLHASNIGADIVSHGYGADPAAVAFDAVAYARKRSKDVVLIDTAGRLQTDVDLMNELRKIAKVVKPDFKIFVGDALTGNDALYQAVTFNQYIGIDGGILTKFDADAKGGSAISFVYAIEKPILYIGTGQGYEDLQPFSIEWFLTRVFE